MRLKSLMLTPILVLLSILTGWGIYAAFTSGFDLGWVGLSLAAIPLPGFVSFIMLTGKTARTSANLPGPLLMSITGLALSFVAMSTPLQPVLASVSFGLLLWYVFIYSRFGRTPSSTLKLGEQLPDFTLEESTGIIVASSIFRAQPTLLLFYRGNWCPLCMAQIREVADAYKRLSQLGVNVVLVSPQPAKETADLAAKFDVPFRFLVDRDHKTAQALDIFAQGGTPVGIDAMGYGEDTVLPTVIATDAKGTIIFLDQTDNYRVRPEPETFLSIFENTLPQVAS